MPAYETMEGSPGLSINDIAHVMLPGRGRDVTGQKLSGQGLSRAALGAEIFTDKELEKNGGVIVCSGYKTPADTNGEPWFHADNPSESFVGVPEADSLRAALMTFGIASRVVRVERRSIDTVTNFTFTEAGGFFGDGDHRPVAIVAQKQHLDRMIKKIAPRTLRRDFIGIVAPEVGNVDQDSLAARFASQVILLGVNRFTSTEKAAARTHWIAEHVWDVVIKASSLRPSSRPYKTDRE